MLTVLVLLGIIGLVALGPMAALAASRLPEPLSSTAVPSGAGSLDEVTRIRVVPVGLPDDARITSIDDVRPFAVRAVGAEAADRLLELLTKPDALDAGLASDSTTWQYPYRFTAVDDALSAVPQSRLTEHGAALGAALMLLAEHRGVPFRVPETAARVAFSVLDHARAGHTCGAQLNLLTLVAADLEVSRTTIASEVRLAERACPRDPTPAWVAIHRELGGLSGANAGTELSEYDAAGLDSARQQATALVERFPTDPGAVATMGDVLLTTGSYLAVSQPFTSRGAFRDAQALFGRLGDGGEDATARLGLARAQLGLGDPGSAVNKATGVADTSTNPGRALQLAVTAAERAHRFATASALARRLEDLGPEAFPELGPGVIPLDSPLTFGADRLTPVSFFILGGGRGGGGLVADEGFVPVYREANDLTDTAESCPGWQWRRDALLAGDVSSAARQWPADFTSVDPMSFAICPDGDRLKRQVDSWLTGETAGDLDDNKVRADVETLLDDRQNLLRWAGDLDAARRVTVAWARQLGDRTALAQQRLGEIDYLSGRFDAAASALAEAAIRWRLVEPGNDLAPDRARLAQGAALLRAGRGTEAVSILRPLALEGAKGYGYQTQGGGSYGTGFATVSYYATTLLADHELASDQNRAAADDLTAALVWSKTLEGEVHLDVARNSAAVALLGTGDIERAAALSKAAVAGDPHSPVYLMTNAAVAAQGGHETEAIRLNRAALDVDRSTYPAANNLGVLLARAGRDDEASRVLRAAVAADPTYALGWHNLGIVEGQRGPLHVLGSQGALARAAAIDPGYADRRLRLVMDDTTYRTALDVSKPLPQGWSFAASQRTASAATAGLLALTLVGAGLIRLRQSAPDAGAKDWLDNLGSRLGRLGSARWARRPGWAVLATVVAFLLTSWRQSLWPWTGVTYIACLMALVGAGMLARVVVARRGVGRVVQGTWAPGVIVGLVSGALGSPIAPMPVVRAPANDSRVAMAAPATLAVLCLVLLAESVLLHVPLTTSLCVAAFIMAGSVLIPVKPLDGARAGAAGVVGAAGLLGALAFLALGLT